jgi:cell division protein FtsZ
MMGNYGATENQNVSGAPTGNNLSGVAKIKVVGVGGAGNNAVDRLIESGLNCAEYVVVNTDNQALARSKATKRIQIGVQLTKGLGAGADPSVGRAAAEENKAEIQEALKNTDLLFITAGMGGGTGTGAAPVIAKIAQEMTILTVAVITLPFTFEAKHRMDNALMGVEELKKCVDSIITIPNDKIRQVVPKGTSFPEALKVADEVLRQGIRGITELIVNHSLINLDFADVKTILKGRGLAHMGIGVAKGEKRIFDAVRCAVGSPLLNTTIEGATAVILNVIGGPDLSLDEVITAADLVKGVIDYSANVIFGACIDSHMSDEVEVVIIATGFNSAQSGFGVAGGARHALPQERPSVGQYPTAMPNRPSNLSQTSNPTGIYPDEATNRAGNVAPGQNVTEGPVSFEPDDPIPDREENTEETNLPKFVRFFMRKDPNNQNKQ